MATGNNVLAGYDVTNTKPVGSAVKIAPNYTCSSNGNLAPVSIPEREGNTETIEGNTILSVYPNPTLDKVTIDGPAAILEVSFINIEGQVLLRTNQSQIDISALPQGLYIVQAVTEDGEILTTKIIHN